MSRYFMKIPDPFTGISGVYYSLLYLSLSDATVLTFLAPTSTTIAAAILLSEKLSWKQLVAGLFSLFGVVLIARPQFLFGTQYQLPDVVPTEDTAGTDSANDVTPAQRLAAVGAAMIGVLGATGACKDPVTVKSLDC
ncbi:hypothetical protein EIP86_005572 [Pleurotus ostreatoroseus]|nr:hypothetical protein EIP86_005572 [Pleurotus ostreatoroseus]